MLSSLLLTVLSLSLTSYNEDVAQICRTYQPGHWSAFKSQGRSLHRTHAACHKEPGTPHHQTCMLGPCNNKHKGGSRSSSIRVLSFSLPPPSPSPYLTLAQHRTTTKRRAQHSHERASTAECSQPSLSLYLSVSFSVCLSLSLPVCLFAPPRWPSGKASASRAENPGFESRLRRDFFGAESYQ